MKHIKLFEEYTPVEIPELNKLDANLKKSLESARYKCTGYDKSYDRFNYQNIDDKNKQIAIFPAGDFKDKLTILYYIPNAVFNGKKLINYDIEYDSPEEANNDLIEILDLRSKS